MNNKNKSEFVKTFGTTKRDMASALRKLSRYGASSADVSYRTRLAFRRAAALLEHGAVIQ